MQSLTFLQLYEHCKCKCNYASACVLQADIQRQVHVHGACLASSINTCMYALHVITLDHCHIVAMGMTLLQLPNSQSLQVLSIKHWYQSLFTETLSTACHSREAHQRWVSMLVYIYIHIYIYIYIYIIYILAYIYTSIDARLPPTRCQSMP